MNKNNIVYDKALDFSVRVVNLYNFLDQKGAAAVMSKQLLRCGTSIGANISESISAESVGSFEKDKLPDWSAIFFNESRLCRNEKLLTSIIVTSKQKKNNN